MAQRDSSPVYYREIQKNAFLKRLPEETTSSKLLPLALKKQPLKPLWTQLCVHNGRTPYLEQYRDPISARAHRPLWRVCLSTARHVTASVTPRDTEHDFLIDTRDGPVRMLAPTWECMQDWVVTLRNKLHELKIVGPCENVYMSAPVAWPARAAARDPTSPLPAPPPVPPVRVPGIDLSSVTRAPVPEPPDPMSEPIEPAGSELTDSAEPEIDISNWDELSVPSTSQAPTSVAKICGQNICLDNSILKRPSSDEEADSDSISSQQMELQSDRPTNITVIQVCNKEPPHTAIPVVGHDNVFNFDFKNGDVDVTTNTDFVNIVNTENSQNSRESQNDYGTVFESDYGHLSLTTTVNLTGDANSKDDVYERLCLATTKPSPQPIRKLLEKRKSSLPNLDTNSTYEYLYLNNNNTNTPISTSNITSISTNTTSISNNATTDKYINFTPNNVASKTQSNVSSTSIGTPTSIVTNTSMSDRHANSTSNVAATSIITSASTNSTSIVAPTSNSTSIVTSNCTSIVAPTSNSTPILAPTSIVTSNSTSNNVTTISTVSVSAVNANVSSEVNRNLDCITRGVRLERTQSQNACDAASPRLRNEARNKEVSEKCEPQHKPIWKRGLTELSLLTRLKIGQLKRADSPGRNADNSRTANGVNGATSPAKVVHRSRTEARPDRSRRRSNSLTNGQSPSSTAGPASLLPLVSRQAMSLMAAQRRGAALSHSLSQHPPPLFVDYERQVWIAWWGPGGARCGGRAGDRVCGLRAAAPRDAAHARSLLHATRAHAVDILFHRVPLAKIFVVNKRDKESIGIKLDSECNIVSVEPDSPASRAGLPPVGKWALTEVNNRPVNLLKGGEDDMHRISFYGTEASVLLQPSALVKKLRAALKGNKNLLGLR